MHIMFFIFCILCNPSVDMLQQSSSYCCNVGEPCSLLVESHELTLTHGLSLSCFHKLVHMLVDYLYLMCTSQTLVQLRCVGVVHHIWFFLLFPQDLYSSFWISVVL
ncbi:hypothetical protein AMTRI_Chr01g132840 [Amborella trichopoda]